MLFLFLLVYTLFAISVGFTPTFIIEPLQLELIQLENSGAVENDGKRTDIVQDRPRQHADDTKGGEQNHQKANAKRAHEILTDDASRFFSKNDREMNVHEATAYRATVCL